jgi:hypothetical protein
MLIVGEAPTMPNSSPSKLTLWMEYSLADLDKSAIRNPQSAIHNPRDLPVAQTDDDPDRVPEVVQPLTSGSCSQVIYLTEANGEIVMSLDI